MNDNIDFYTESDLDVHFNDFYEIEGVNKIKVLSRQLRTFFNYKAEIIQFRFQANVPSNHIPKKNNTNSEFFIQKREIESLSQEFISLLNSIKRDDSCLEQEIYYLHFKKNSTKFKRLSTITEKLFTLIHVFSEDNIQGYPNFLKFIVVLAHHVCFVKKCLNAEFYQFYEELELNYQNLEKEFNDLLGNIPNIENKIAVKRREERLLL